ncbi:Rieske 2Fe-2S domain-containing protein [Streptomyces sp. NPDC056405]|uniref:Rieske 2Fe-2S domain-containing protein n=1 Tax=Streptomyces sp. NPDC056405 TaxID=3345811 RepID=UPI0035DC72E7
MNAEAREYPLDEFSAIDGNAAAAQYLAKFWQPVALSRDYIPGTAKRIKILGNHHTLYRGEGGQLNLVQDRCPHRGTSLAYGWVEDNCIRCRYHGWKFSGDGAGVEFPAETATYEQRISLESHPVREYLGVVFAYLGGGEAPDFPQYPELEDESAGELMSMSVTLPYNYFQRVENDVDEVHIYYVHREFMASFGLVDLPRITAKETDYGLVCTTVRSDGSKFLTHMHMPNAFLREAAIGQDKEELAIHAAWRVPIDDVSTLSVMIDRVKNYDPKVREGEKEMIDPTEIAQQILAGEFTLEEADQNHPLLPVIQDTVAMAGQGLVADRANENLGQSDRALGLLRRIWSRELKALREERPLKSWHRSAGKKLPMFLAAADSEVATGDSGGTVAAIDAGVTSGGS